MDYVTFKRIRQNAVEHASWNRFASQKNRAWRKFLKICAEQDLF